MFHIGNQIRIGRFRKVFPAVTVLAALGMLVGPALAQPVVITAGNDAWRTGVGGTNFEFSSDPIPAGFFGEGSEPFDRRISLRGAPLNTDPPLFPGFDTVDAIVARLDATELDVGESGDVAIQLIALSLVNVDPIAVYYEGQHDPEEWNVKVCLTDFPPVPPEGQGLMTITRTHDDGGTFDAQSLPVIPKFIFTNKSNPLDVQILDCQEYPDVCGDLILENPDGHWFLEDGPGLFKREEIGLPQDPVSVSFIDVNCNGLFTDPFDLGSTTIHSSNFVGGVEVIVGGGRFTEYYCQRQDYLEGALGRNTGSHEAFISADDTDGNGIPDVCEMGACCHDPAPYSCTEELQKNCVSPDIPQGPNTECTGLQACCLVDGTCTDVDPICCDEMPPPSGGGVPQGGGTVCLDPSEFELCCMPDGSQLTIDPRCCVEIGGVVIAGAKMENPQCPDPEGWDVNATFPVVLADDWRCDRTTWVEDIHFWGSWMNDVEGDIAYFIVSIHADIPDPDGEGPLFSMPGELLWGRVIKDWDQELIDGPLEGWYDPVTGINIPNDHTTFYRYDITNISDPFWQEDGTIYWLDVSAVVLPDVPLRFWGWKSSQQHWMDDAVWGEDPTFTWVDLYEPETTQSLDLAFVITGVPGDDDDKVPAVSEWGVVVMVLLVVTAVTIVIRKRRAMATS